MSRNIALRTLKLIVSDRNQSKVTLKANEPVKQKHVVNKVVSIGPFLRRNAGYNFGGKVA